MAEHHDVDAAFPPAGLSNWRALLDRALPVLDAAFAAFASTATTEPTWTVGGPTALALAIKHRATSDLDISIAGLALQILTPKHNRAAAEQFTAFDWVGNCLALECAEGRVRFLSAERLSEPGIKLVTYKGREAALETPIEVIAKMVRFCAATLFPTEAFDLAAAHQAVKGVPEYLGTEASDLLETLAGRLQALRKERSCQPVDVRGATDPLAYLKFEDALDVIVLAMNAASAHGWRPSDAILHDGPIIDTIEAAIARVPHRPLRFWDENKHVAWLRATVTARRITSVPSAVPGMLESPYAEGEERSLDERARLTAPGLRTFLNLAHRWRLSEADQVRILRAPSVEQLRVWKAINRTDAPLLLLTDVLMRISAVVGLFGDLHPLKATEDEERRWLRQPIKAEPFNNQTPMQRLLDGTIEDLLAVRRYVLALQSGQHAPNEVDRDFLPYSDDDLKWH